MKKKTLLAVKAYDHLTLPSQEVSYHQYDDVMDQVNATSMSDTSILDVMIKLEEAMGCSIFEMARRERERQLADRTVDAGFVHPAPGAQQ